MTDAVTFYSVGSHSSLYWSQEVWDNIVLCRVVFCIKLNKSSATSSYKHYRQDVSFLLAGQPWLSGSDVGFDLISDNARPFSVSPGRKLG